MAEVEVLTPFEAARLRFSPVQRRVAVALGILTVGLALLDWVRLVQVLVIVNLAYAGVFFLLRLGAVVAMTRGSEPDAPPAEADLPVITVLCPLYREPESVRNLIAALGRLDYPRDRLEILVLLEADDDETPEAIGTPPPYVRVLTIPPGGPKTKPNALNAGLLASRGEIVGIYDAEDRPETMQLRKVAAAFAAGGERLGCVQAKLNYYNRDDTLISRMFALEYALHFDWFLPGLTKLGLPLPLGGTSNFIRREALFATGAWDPWNVTEDADLGLRLADFGYRMTTIDSTTYEEATDTPNRWIHQRSRWIKGFIQTAFVHMRRPLGWREALVLHGALGAVAVSSLINPLTWTMFLAWWLTGWTGLDPVFEGPLRTVCAVMLVAGNAANLWVLMMAPITRGWYALVPTAFFLPFYWVLQSVAGYKALAGFAMAPHYWDKTSHSAGAGADLELLDA